MYSSHVTDGSESSKRSSSDGCLRTNFSTLPTGPEMGKGSKYWKFPSVGANFQVLEYFYSLQFVIDRKWIV